MQREATLPSLTLAGSARLTMILGATLLASGCIGGQDYATIRAEAQRRGGGAEPFLVREAEAAVAKALSAEAGSVVLASISIAPDKVVLVAADPRTPDNWDTYSYASGRLGDSTPARVGSDAPCGFLLDEFRALDRLPALVVDARARIGFAEGRLIRVQIAPAANAKTAAARVPGPGLRVSVSDPRQGTAEQQYDADGRPL